ncbi:MAG: hypothetical protein CYPHOPRED_000823 [Cyphobasidiales sp. Tagirdzhanova-0007]|nr:MAG: hypothetical protein CYPHOPRED_000823 [Cyphobasidiales sp. Tagirdzhanova-0007]
MSEVSQITAAYRRALRLVPQLEGQRRRRLCVFRTREILSRALRASHDLDKVRTYLTEVDVYLDQIGAQATHLRALARDSKNILVPIDLYSSEQNTKIILDAMPGRRVSEKERSGQAQKVLKSRLFEGPEPSWLQKKRKASQE